MTPPGTSTAGVLPISVSATQKPAPPARSASNKTAAPRLKLLIRRLPPGLTQAELETALGEEWKLGAGKIDWVSYKEGRVSKNPANPSRPSRAYVRVTSLELVTDLSDRVRSTTFQDARNTHLDPALIGPPTVEYAPYPRVPGGRTRKDARQGTIDQDPDFIAFLESLTNPVVKPPVDITAEPEKEPKITTTPLIQFLKEKKANKGKESGSSAKSSRHGRGGADSKDGKSEKVQAKKLLSRAEKASPRSAEKQAKLDKATKEAVKAVNKQVSSQGGKAAGKAAALSTKEKDSKESSKTTPSPAGERKPRERGDITAATKILRRDLGLGPSAGKKRTEKEKATGTTSPKKESAPTSDLKSPPTPKGPKATEKATSAKPPKTTPTEPASDRKTGKQANPPSNPAPKTSAPSRNKPPATESTATQAFLKHANPSQGVTEDLLQTSFSQFGKVTKCEIDKKKGFGYIDFAEPEGLRKAIQASPVEVAESKVVVLERKTGAAVAQARAAGNNNNSNSGNKDANNTGGGNNKTGSPPTGPAASRQRSTPPTGPRGRGGSKGRGGFGKGGRGGKGASTTTSGGNASEKPA